MVNLFKMTGGIPTQTISNVLLGAGIPTNKNRLTNDLFSRIEMDSKDSQPPGPSTPGAAVETGERHSLSALYVMKAYYSSGEMPAGVSRRPLSPPPM